MFAADKAKKHEPAVAVNEKSNVIVKGNGDGGIIRVINKTDSLLDISWSGEGCLANIQDMYEVCAAVDVPPAGEYTWGYGWGGTITWLNIGIKPSDRLPHPCAQSAYSEEKCLFDHMNVDTTAHKLMVCTLTGSNKDSSIKANCGYE